MARKLRPGELVPDVLGLHYQVPGWQSAIDAGDVADQPDDAHPVATMAPGNQRPCYVTRAWVGDRMRSRCVGMLGDLEANVSERMDRLDAGDVVRGWTAAYQLVPADGLAADVNGTLPRHHVATAPMGTP